MYPLALLGDRLLQLPREQHCPFKISEEECDILIAQHGRSLWNWLPLCNGAMGKSENTIVDSEAGLAVLYQFVSI